MLSFEEFKKEMAVRVGDVLRRGRTNIDVAVVEIPKDNRMMTGITIIAIGQKITMSPVVYLEELYEMYVQGEDVEAVVKEVDVEMEKAIRKQEHVLNILNNQETARANIVFDFLQTKENQEILNMMPHRPFQDLSIVYVWFVEMDGKEINKIPVTDEVMEFLGVDEEELYELAYENTKRKLEPVVLKLEEVNSCLASRTTDYVDLFDAKKQFRKSLVQLYAITNRGMNLGATTVLYKEELQKLAEKIDADLLLIPISKKMMMAVSSKVISQEDLMEYLCLKKQEQTLDKMLSEEIYLYDKTTQEICMTTDSRQKMSAEENNGMSVSM